MRQVILDTETTGLDPSNGDRLVEIGCVEIINYVPSGRFFHAYLNPERNMPSEAFNVHGLSEEFLKDKPKFREVVDEFLNFIEDHPLVIHNAPFDMKFINHELMRLGKAEINFSRAIDTLSMARQKFPGAQASLDALCRRFKVDSSKRTKHGALLDAELLAEVYLELCGGRQPDLVLANENNTFLSPHEIQKSHKELEPRPHSPSSEELEAHHRLLAKLTKPIWFQ